jgi:hypothetical protein
VSRFTDAYGTPYVAERESWRASREVIKGQRGSGFTVRRVGPRPVDIKRAKRAARRAAAAIVTP